MAAKFNMATKNHVTPENSWLGTLNLNLGFKKVKMATKNHVTPQNLWLGTKS